MSKAVEISYEGPWFDGRAQIAMRDMNQAIGEDLQQYADSEVHKRLHQVLRHPTGYYESNITPRTLGNLYVVDDNGVIYGPWLEGTSSRNQTTRFKGYATFRWVGQRVAVRAQELADVVAQKYVRRMQ